MTRTFLIFIAWIETVHENQPKAENRMLKYSAVHEISRFLCMADDVGSNT